MTWKQIEASREVRLWVKEIVVPIAVGFTALYATVPEFKNWVRTTASNTKNKVKSKFGRKEEGSA